MLNIIFITRFHPNEEAAVEMAKLVAERLKTEGRSDVDLSREAGFLCQENVNLLAGKILEVVERREKSETLK